jgi:hypothetical protein
LGIYRYKYGKAEDLNMPYLLFLFFRRRVCNEANMQGYGRHTKEEGKFLIFELVL